MKFRRNKVKREHGIIQNALLWLENLGRLSEVTDIIPGVIDVTHSSERGIVYKYETQTGCKLLIKSNGSIQEVFVVTKDPSRVQEWVMQKFPPDPNPSVAQVTSSAKRQLIPRIKFVNVSPKSKHRSKNKSATSDLSHSRKRSFRKVLKTFLDDKDVSNVADNLDRVTINALHRLKQSLENDRIKSNRIKCPKSPEK